MIINNKKWQAFFIGSIVMGLFSALLFIFLILPAYKQYIHVPENVVPLLSLLNGFFILIAIGMLLTDDSRMNGLLFLIMFLIITAYYINIHQIDQYAFAGGIIFGIILNYIVISKNRFDILAVIAKIMLTCFFIIIFCFLLIGFSNTLNPAIPLDTHALAGNNSLNSETGTAYTIQQTFYWGIGLLALVIIYLLLMKIIIGVKASQIFVIGPRKSGKSYLLLGLYNHIVNQLGGFADQVILSADENDEESLRLSTMYTKTLKHEEIKRTFRYHMGLYQLSAKKFFGLCPVTWTVVDYAGEYYNKLDEKTFRDALNKLTTSLGMSYDQLSKKVGTIEFLKEINTNHKDKMLDTEFVQNIIISTMYGNMQRAGKIIFLFDGQDLVDTSDPEKISKYIGQYIKMVMGIEGGTLFKFLGGNKKYAVVVTKFDRLLHNNSRLKEYLRLHTMKSLSDVDDKSLAAGELEKTTYKLLERFLVFKSFINIINDFSTFFIVVSADSTLKPGMRAENSEEEMTPREISPWRFSEIFKFGF